MRLVESRVMAEYQTILIKGKSISLLFVRYENLIQTGEIRNPWAWRHSCPVDMVALSSIDSPQNSSWILEHETVRSSALRYLKWKNIFWVLTLQCQLPILIKPLRILFLRDCCCCCFVWLGQWLIKWILWWKITLSRRSCATPNERFVLIEYFFRVHSCFNS